MHRATRRFWNAFHELPSEVQTLAKENFRLLKRDSRHPSLHFKKIGKFWSARVGLEFRALAVQEGPDFIWVWIGSHDAYGKLLKTQG